MNSKYTKRLIEVFFLLSIIISCITSVCVNKFFAPDAPSIYHDAIQELPHGWQYEDSSGRKEISHLPATVKLHHTDDSMPECLTLYYQLPDELPRNPCLEFVSQQTSVEVVVDGQVIYTYGVDDHAPVGELLGNARNIVILPLDAGGKEVSIRLASPYSPDTYRIGMITLGTRAEILYRFVNSSIGLTVFCLLSVFFCLIALFFAIYFRIKRIELNTFSVVSFALFIFLSTVWILTDSNILQLFTDNFSLVYFISHMAFMLFPVPLLLFLRQTTAYGQRWYNALCMMHLLGFFLRVGLFFGGVADLESTLFITHVMMGISAVTGCILLAREWHLYHDKTSLMFLIGFISLGVCLIISLMVFFLAPEPTYSIYFCIMLVVMMIAMLYRIISQLETMAKEGIKAQVYQEMAYIDVLTKLSNRLDFEEHMQAVQEKPECYMITLVMFDINRLKHINDTYGHSVGDRLIQCAADCIQQKFAPIGKCYRIGGDEFAVVLKDFSEQSLDRIMKEFQNSVDEADTGNPEGLSISVGYATGPAEGDNFAYHLLHEADQRMYFEKEKSHNQHRNC